MLNGIELSVDLLSIVMLCLDADCHYDEFCYAESHAECRYAECHYN